jgi:hypothetical protein
VGATGATGATGPTGPTGANGAGTEILTGYAALVPQGSSTGFIGLAGQPDVLASDADAAGVVPVTGKITSLYVTADAFGAGGQGAVTATLWHDGSATSVSCTLQPGGTSDATCNSTGVSVAIAAGDTVSIEITNNASKPFLRDVRWSAEMSP